MLRKYELCLMILLFAMVAVRTWADLGENRKEPALKGIFFLSLIGIIVWAITPYANGGYGEYLFIAILCISGFMLSGFTFELLKESFIKELRRILKICLKKIL